MPPTDSYKYLYSQGTTLRYWNRRNFVEIFDCGPSDLFDNTEGSQCEQSVVQLVNINRSPDILCHARRKARTSFTFPGTFIFQFLSSLNCQFYLRWGETISFYYPLRKGIPRAQQIHARVTRSIGIASGTCTHIYYYYYHRQSGMLITLSKLEGGADTDYRSTISRKGAKADGALVGTVCTLLRSRVTVDVAR